MSSNREASVVEKKASTNQTGSVLEEIQGNSSRIGIDGAEKEKWNSPTKSPRKGMPQQIKSPKESPVKMNVDHQSISAQTDIEKTPQVSPMVISTDVQLIFVSGSKNAVSVDENSKMSTEYMNDIESDEEIGEELQRLNKTAQEINYISDRKRPREDESPENKIIKRARWELQNLGEDQNESREEEEMQRSAHASSMPVLPQVVLNPPIRPIPRIPVPFNLAQFGFFQGAENHNYRPVGRYYGSSNDQASPLNCDRGFIARNLFDK